MMRLVADAIAAISGFISFQPGGHTVAGIVSADTSVRAPLKAGKPMEGRMVLRIGMSLAKRSRPIPDPPGIAGRFAPSSNTVAISRINRGTGELEILFAAGPATEAYSESRDPWPQL